MFPRLSDRDGEFKEAPRLLELPGIPVFYRRVVLTARQDEKLCHQGRSIWYNPNVIRMEVLPPSKDKP